MNKQITNKAITIFKRVAKDMGIEQHDIRLGESPMDSKRSAIYIDGDLYDEYKGQGFTGYKFHDKLIDEMDKAGIFIEPYTYSIIDVYKA